MKNVSPKVTAASVTTLVLTVLVGALGAVTPGMLSALGPWAGVVTAAITALVAALGALAAGYVVTDPARKPVAQDAELGLITGQPLSASQAPVYEPEAADAPVASA